MPDALPHRDMTSPRALARRSLRAVRRVLGDDPIFLPIVLRATPMGTSKGIQPNTVLVIEGFPRSGNTFAYFALRRVLPDEQHIATRVHVPAQVALAVRRQLPTLYVIRDPVDTIASLLIAAPHVPIGAAIDEYVHHHREVLKHRHGFVVGEFQVVTTRFGEVVDALNERFDLQLPPFAHTEEAAAQVFADIDAHHAEVWGATEHVVPRPSASRAGEKAWLLEQLQSHKHNTAMRSAREVYEAFLEPARG